MTFSSTARTTILSFVVGAVAVAACGGDKAKNDTASANTPANASPEVYRKKQQQFADSVLNSAAPVAKVAEQLGKGYTVATTQLRDTIAYLAGASDCYAKGRVNDPYLAGTVTFMAHMSPIGIDLIQVQEKNWTSPAGDLVNACLNLAAKNWKLDMRYGKPAAYLAQVQFKLDSALLPIHKDTTAKKP